MAVVPDFTNHLPLEDKTLTQNLLTNPVVSV